MFNLSETYHSLNPIILRKTSFHEMMLLYKRTINKCTKEKIAEGTKQGDKVITKDNGDVTVIRQASDSWF